MDVIYHRNMDVKLNGINLNFPEYEFGWKASIWLIEVELKDRLNNCVIGDIGYDRNFPLQSIERETDTAERWKREEIGGV